MNQDWEIVHQDGEKTDKADCGGVKLTTILSYKGQEMMRKSGMMGRQSLHNLCVQYNLTLYVPKVSPTCIADLPVNERLEAIRKLPNYTEGFPNLIMNPEENSKALRKYKLRTQQDGIE